MVYFLTLCPGTPSSFRKCSYKRSNVSRQHRTVQTRGEAPMSKIATNTNLKLPLLLKPAQPGWWRQVKNFKGLW